LQKETGFLHKSSLKHLATPAERKPNEFIKNRIFDPAEKQFFK
jgi:N utilization substance protein B